MTARILFLLLLVFVQPALAESSSSQSEPAAAQPASGQRTTPAPTSSAPFPQTNTEPEQNLLVKPIQLETTNLNFAEEEQLARQRIIQKKGIKARIARPKARQAVGLTVSDLIIPNAENAQEPDQGIPAPLRPLISKQLEYPAAINPPLLPGMQSGTQWQERERSQELDTPIKIVSVLTRKLAVAPEAQDQQDGGDTQEMLASLAELIKNLKSQIKVTKRRQRNSYSDTEKLRIQEELSQLDKQLSEATTDFERIATGVEPNVFAKQPEDGFSWRKELASLLEPSIKELKQLTARARQKTYLKDEIDEHRKQLATAKEAVAHLNTLIKQAKEPAIKASLQELLPPWKSAEKRIHSKLELAQLELHKLEAQDVSLMESSSRSIRDFFRNRGLYLVIAFAAFILILFCFRLLSRLIFHYLPGAKRDRRPVHIRILDITLRVLSITSAFCGLIFVLYTAEDWFLLSMTIIFFLALAWTIRQGLPKLWQQARIMLNMGSVREGERLLYLGVPWRVDSLNVFCKLSNPTLGQHLRIPIEHLVGMVSRPYKAEEAWFPCRKGDWLVIEGRTQAKVTSLSLEQVELVELSGRRIIYLTPDFLSLATANLSTSFTVRVVFGLSYDLQAQITDVIPDTLKSHIRKQLDEHGYGANCLGLNVEFLQAGASSLDLVVLADFRGDLAGVRFRLERALNRWCVECANEQSWEIPFPQMTVHLPSLPAQTITLTPQEGGHDQQ